MGYFPLFIGAMCLIVLFVIGLILYDLVLMKIKTYSIPGPKGLPLLGSAVELLTLRVQDQVHWILGNSFKFKNGLYKLWLGPDLLIMVSSPQHLEKILPSLVNINKSVLYDALRPWLGQGLITSSGQEWFHDRKLLTPTFHFSILEKYVPVMNEECEVMLRCIEKKLKENPGQPVEMYDIIINCALDILCATSMGIDIHAQEQETEYTRALHKFSELTFHRMFSPWFKQKWTYMLSSTGREYYSQLKVLHNFTQNVLDKRIEWRKTHKDDVQNDDMVDEFGKKRKKALLDHLLDASENTANPFTVEKIREQMDTFMFAGHDTTATAFAWCLFCLGNSPEHQENVHKELDDVFGDSDRPPTLKDLSQLKHLDRVLKESLRLYPSVAIFGRKLVEDVDIGDYVLPKGANLAFGPILTHRRPDVYKNPETFDPDRFLPENMKNRNPYAYIPFSAGPRNCIGQKFAQIEEKIMAVYILRKWKLKSVHRHGEVPMLLPIVLKPLNGIHLYLTPRK